MNSYGLSYRPLLLGIDQFDHLVGRMGQDIADSYPPFNIEQAAADRLRIEIAVAGFEPADLSVDLDQGDLIVRGRRSDRQERTYLHRGIATRQFKRVFRLAEGLEVGSAELENGILKIELRRAQLLPEVHRIAVRTEDAAAGRGEKG